LEEITGLLKLDEEKACLKTREMAAQKLSLIEEKISDLFAIKNALSGLVHACDSSSSGEPCPIIHLLVED
jgi:MerR family mercuric resistance operon transcriptional regulator